MTLPDDLRDALATIPVLAAKPHAAWRVERLGGVTNRNYRLHLETAASSPAGAAPEDYVLRLPGAGTSLYLNRPAGIHNAALAADLDIAPAVVHSDAARGWQLSRYLPGVRSLDSDDLQSPAILVEIGRLLGRLQQAGLTFQHEMRPFVIADRYLGLAPVPSLLRLRRQARAIEIEIEMAGRPLVAAHIDPNPTNFLIDAAGRLHLIDWEFSAMAEASWDLAAIVLEGALSSANITLLLQAAGHAADAATLRRLDLFQCALCLVAASWAYVEIAAGNDDAALRDFAAARSASFARRLTQLAMA